MSSTSVSREFIEIKSRHFINGLHCSLMGPDSRRRGGSLFLLAGVAEQYSAVPGVNAS